MGPEDKVEEAESTGPETIPGLDFDTSAFDRWALNGLKIEESSYILTEKLEYISAANKFYMCCIPLHLFVYSLLHLTLSSNLKEKGW